MIMYVGASLPSLPLCPLSLRVLVNLDNGEPIQTVGLSWGHLCRSFCCLQARATQCNVTCTYHPLTTTHPQTHATLTNTPLTHYSLTHAIPSSHRCDQVQARRCSQKCAAARVSQRRRQNKKEERQDTCEHMFPWLSKIHTHAYTHVFCLYLAIFTENGSVHAAAANVKGLVRAAKASSKAAQGLRKRRASQGCKITATVTTTATNPKHDGRGERDDR